MASRPSSAGKFEIETAEDFYLPQDTRVTSATFFGLLTGALPVPAVSNVRVEIYRVFPSDSDTVRIPNVPTRVNSPSDVELVDATPGAGA